MKYKIIKDTREKLGWSFNKSKYCSGMVVAKLDTGDYSLEGLEDILCIERKGSIAEFAGNITQARFVKELERMEKFRFPFLLLEFDMTQLLMYPENSGIPRSKQRYLKFTGTFILKKLIEFEFRYKIKIILCGHHGKEVVLRIFKEVVEILASEE